MRKLGSSFVAFVATLALGAAPASAGSPPAFPGAQGFGAKATGGRGGQVLRVTNLNTSGAGSLQWALDQAGPRIIVFRVSGLIAGDVRIPHGDVTIAGQTATGAGITILGHLYTDFGDPTSNMILRHLRVRPPNPGGDWPAAQHDSIQFSTAHTFILDHVDASHGADETIDAWGGAYDVTLQWSALTYPIYDPGNGWTHNTGIINHRACIDDASCGAGDPLGGRISIHHNLFAHARNRTPALSTGPAEVVNNVVYNGREGFVHHNLVGAASTSATAIGDFNLIGNWYIDGPSAALVPLWFDPENPTTPIPTRYHSWDNWVEDPGDFNGRFDNPFATPGFEDAYGFYCCGIAASQFTTPSPFDFASFPGHRPVGVDAGGTLVSGLLARVGAFPRDIVNRWAVEDVTTRTGAWANRRPANWLEGLTPGTPPVDADADGMADAWELAHGLDPANGADHATVSACGWTAIEEYINGVADSLVFDSLFRDGFETGDTCAWS